MKVEYSASHFSVFVNFEQSDLARSIPERRWNAYAKCWIAPDRPLNVRYLAGAFPRRAFSPSAWDKVKEFIEPAAPVEQGPLDTSKFICPMFHQLRAAEAAWDKTAYAFFMEMGTGKTKTTIDLASALASSKLIDSVLVLAPVSVRQVWVDELARWSSVDHSVFILNVGTERATTAAIDTHTNSLRWCIAGIESMSQGKGYTLAHRFLTGRRTLLVVDESSKIKNPEAVRTKRITDLGIRAVRRLILTGTPVTQGLQDLYSQFYFLDPGILENRSYYAFRNRYCIMGGYEDRQVTGYKNVPEFLARVGPHSTTINRADVVDLPPKIYQTRLVGLSSEQTQIYKEIRDGLTAQNALVIALRLQQLIGGHPADYALKTNPKLNELLELSEELDGKTIVWARFLPEVNSIFHTLCGKTIGSVVMHHGEMSIEARSHSINRFVNDPQVRFFVATQQSAGYGLNLTVARNVVYYSNTFSYEQRIQSEDRAHRIGQTGSVLYVDLVANCKVDLAIRDSLVKKQDFAKKLNRGLKEVSSYM